MKKDKFLLLILSCTALVFAILNFFTPLIGDDFAYLYKFGPSGELRPSNVPVKNLPDVFESQYYHYLDVNGRFFSQFLLQFLLFLGKSIFNILNVLVFITLIYFIFCYSFDRLVVKKNVYLILLIITMIWFLSPFIGQTMLWMTGAIVYLWSACFVVIFLYYFKKEHWKTKSNLFLVFLFIFSLLIGGTNESLTFGVAATLFFNALFRYNRLSATEWVMTLGFGLGVLGIIFSPGTFNRVGNEVVISPLLMDVFVQKMKDVVAIVYHLKFSIAISIVLLLFLKLKKEPILIIIIQQRIILGSILFNCWW